MNILDYYCYLFYDLIFTFLKLFVTVIITVTLGHYLLMWKQKIGMPPGPIPLPLIGTLYVLPKDKSETPIEIGNICKKYGDLCTLILPDLSRVVVMTDMNLIRDTFIRNISAAGRPFVDTWATTFKIFEPTFPKLGIVFGQYNEQLKLQRHISVMALKSLGYGNLNIMEQIITKEISHVIAAFKDKNGEAFNPRPLFAVATNNVSCALLFDERFDYEDEEASNLIHCVQAVFQMLASSRFLNNLWFVKYLPSQKEKLKRFAEYCKRLNNFVRKKVKQRKLKMEDGKQCKDFITSYLKEVQNSNGALEDRSPQVVKDFFGAAMETTTTTLTWIFYFMIKHPDVQSKVRTEIKELVGEGKFPALQDRRSLPYTEATIAEIMRVSPTAPSAVQHSTITDTVIGGYNIPKGTEVGALFIPAAWDEKLFPEPHVLKPERHLDSDGKFVRNDNLAPFGVGKRSCLGEQLARQELFLFLTHLVQTFQFKVPEGEMLPSQRGKCALTYAPQAYRVSAVPL